jgi:hypothetical protein
MHRTMLLILAGLLVVGGTGYAHHSFSATYDQTTEITIETRSCMLKLRIRMESCSGGPSNGVARTSCSVRG